MAEVSFERRRLKVYVAGPISTGDTFENVHRAIRWGRQMVFDGLAPFVPHFDAFMLASAADISWNAYLEWDLEWVASSDAVFRVSGESKGGDLEVAHAEALNLPVFYEHPALEQLSYQDLLTFASLKGLTGVRA
jgi:hypothetical protein